MSFPCEHWWPYSLVMYEAWLIELPVCLVVTDELDTKGRRGLIGQSVTKTFRGLLNLGK